MNLPKKKAIPTLMEYSKTYLELYRDDKENTRLGRMRAVNALLKYLGSYRLDKITSFVVEKFKIERKEKDRVGNVTINSDIAILSHLFAIAIKSDILSKNPCKEVKKTRITETRDRILSSGEIALLLEKLHGKDRLMVIGRAFYRDAVKRGFTLTVARYRHP